jgi:hypothetical protein
MKRKMYSLASALFALAAAIAVFTPLDHYVVALFAVLAGLTASSRERAENDSTVSQSPVIP